MGEVRELYFGRERDFQEPNHIAQRMQVATGQLAQQYAGDLAGFVLVAVTKEGFFRLHWAVDEATVLGPTMLAGLATQAIQRDLVVEPKANEVLVRNNLIRDDE